MKSEIEWIACEERMPSDDILDHFLVIVRERWSDDTSYIYNVDYARNHGDYIDNYWDTYNDWKEGQEVHITHWAEIPNPFEGKDTKESEVK